LTPSSGGRVERWLPLEGDAHMAKSLKKRVKALEKRLQEIEHRLEARDAGNKPKRSRVIALHKEKPRKASIAKPELRHSAQAPSGISGSVQPAVSSHSSHA
jgi:hypothetical protein